VLASLSRWQLLADGYCSIVLVRVSIRWDDPIGERAAALTICVFPASVRDASIIGLIRFLPRSVRAMGGRHGETEGRRHGAAAGVIPAA
jgi:hypothetical protein